MAKNIGIISVKGGVGKTSLTHALGVSLAKDFHKKVLLVDANFSAPNLALHMGLIDPEVTLHHVLNDKVEAHKAIYESEHGFHVIPGSIVHGVVNPFKLRSKLKPLQKYYDYILLDSSPTLNSEILASIIASDELYIVTTPDHVTLNATLRTVNLAKEKQTPIRGIIVNKIYNKNFELSLEDIEKMAGCKVLAMVPHDMNVLEALSEMTPASVISNNSFSKEVHKLAGALIGQQSRRGFIQRVREMFRLTPQQEINRALFAEDRKFGIM
jgi:MinD-like ATPase involved in chromosome partitioning or flagellar assembly